MGRCSRDIHAHLLGDLLTVLLQSVLTAAEQRLVRMRVTSNIAAASWRIVSQLCHQILKMVACVRGQSDSPLVGKQLGDVGQEWGTPSDNSFPPTEGRFGFDAKPLVRRTGGPHLSSINLIREVAEIRPGRAITVMTPAISLSGSGFVTPHPNSISFRASVFTTAERNGSSRVVVSESRRKPDLISRTRRISILFQMQLGATKVFRHWGVE